MELFKSRIKKANPLLKKIQKIEKNYNRSNSCTSFFELKHAYNMYKIKFIDPEDFWKILDLIGNGSFGKIYKCKNLQDDKVGAMKVLNLNENLSLEQLLIELEILNKCNHKNIVKFYDAFIHNDKLYIIMEYCSLGSLDSIINDLNRNLTEDEIRFIIQQVLEAILYLHENLFVIHRDIKAANILVTKDGKMKLADFGVSTRNQYLEQKKSTFTGSPYWVSPEVINCSSLKFMRYNYKADIWSLGITCIELAEKQPPNTSLNPKEAMKKTKHENSPKLKEPSKWSEHFQNFIAQCLVKNPKDRPTACQLINVVTFIFFPKNIYKYYFV